MANLNNYIMSFIKVSIFTTLLFGGLLAQSYATNLVTNTLAKMDIEFTAKNNESHINQTASTTLRNL